MPNEPRRLPIEAIIEKNGLEVTQTGERHFLRDVALLEATWARPETPSSMARKTSLHSQVRLPAGIAQAYAVEHGNKRTAFQLDVAFSLGLNAV